MTGAEHSILKIVDAAHNGTEGLLTEGDHLLVAAGDLQHGIGPAFPQQHRVCAGNYVAVGIHNAEGTVSGILKLYDYTLKNTVRHFPGLLK